MLTCNRRLSSSCRVNVGFICPSIFYTEINAINISSHGKAMKAYLIHKYKTQQRMNQSSCAMLKNVAREIIYS
jgi:hypothetical protein